MGIGALASFSVPSIAAEDIVIGAAGPLSGAQAFFGTTWHNGAKLYFDTVVNPKGGIKGRQVKIQQMDDKADPREGTTIAQHFCDEGDILAIIGHLNSGVTIPTMDIYSGCDLPQITVSSSPQVTELGYKNIFQPTPNDFAQGRIGARYAYEQLAARKAAVVNDKQAFGQGVSEKFAETFQQMGGSITSLSGLNATDMDFSSTITALKQQQPDVIYLGFVMPQLALFAKQAQELGLTAKLIMPDGGYTDELMKLGGNGAEGALVSFQAPPYDSSPELRELRALYSKTFNSDPGPQTVYGWVQAQILANAMQNADELSRTAILEELRKTDLDTALGHIKFDDKGGISSGGLYLYQVEGGKFKLVSND
ncbi:branched-chain amino acid ABC transporter substrate-binding protein [Pseudomonas cavernae]|nr:branched-chain amino acid ABC transporter substrate-binding protein [Pseudomonas cavernae]